MAQSADAAKFYGEMADIATDLLTEFQQATVKLVRTGTTGGKPYNPVAGQSVKYTFKGATVRGVSSKYIDGKDIITTDMQVSLSVAQFDETGAVVSPSVRPLVTDKLEINGKLFNIIADKTVPPAGVAVAYIIIFRK
jgi:hypothetical protein